MQGDLKVIIRMLNVVIDSSIINQDRGFRGSDSRLFKELASMKLLQWRIPWVVWREIVTKGEIDSLSSITQMRGLLKDYQRIGQSNTVLTKVAKADKIFSTLESACGRNNSAYWDSLLKTTNAIIEPMDSLDGKNVMESYFWGSPPFPNPKSRKDIPDAFIFESIKRISRQCPIVFICNDSNLSNECSKLANITCCNSFKDFYEMDVVKSVLKSHETKTRSQHGIQFISKHKDDILRQAHEDVWGDLLVQFNYDGVKSDYIPGDEGILTEVLEPMQIQVLPRKTKYIEDTFHIPVFVKCRFGLEYYLPKSSFAAYKSRTISIMENGWCGDDEYRIKEIYDADFYYNYLIRREDVDKQLMSLVMDEQIYDLHVKPIFKDA